MRPLPLLTGRTEALSSVYCVNNQTKTLKKKEENTVTYSFQLLETTHALRLNTAFTMHFTRSQFTNTLYNTRIENNTLDDSNP